MTDLGSKSERLLRVIIKTMAEGGTVHVIGLSKNGNRDVITERADVERGLQVLEGMKRDRVK